jgi:hypothetical protein
MIFPLLFVVVFAQEAPPLPAMSSEPTAITCQFERLDDARKYVGTDRLAVFLPKGMSNLNALDAETRDPAALTHGGTFGSMKVLPNGIFALQSSGWPPLVLTMQPNKTFGTNAIIGPVSLLNPKDNEQDRNGICRTISGPSARETFERWISSSTLTERG